jgi:cytochrome c peroxidase
VIYDHYKAEYEAVFGRDHGTLPDLTDTARFPANGKPGQPSYDGMAQADKDTVTRIYVNFAKAVAAYEGRLVSLAYEPSPFDRMLLDDDKAMSPAAVRGAKLFVGKAACNECHRGSMFTDAKFHNIGCPQGGGNVPAVDVGRTAGIAGAKGDVFNRAGMFSDNHQDGHLATLEPGDADVGAFKTGTLRNISLTAPYMHDGVYTNLWDVVNHYNFGGGTGVYSGTKEVTLAPLLLDNGEIDDIVEFLRSLQDGAPLATDDFPEGLGTPPTLPM